MGWASRLQRKGGLQLKLLLLFTLVVMVGFAFPRLIWTTHVGYTLIALMLTQVMVRDGLAPIWADRLYRSLGLLAVLSMWLWLLTPHELIYSGVPLALSWSVLVGWSVIRLVKRFAQEPSVSEALLMGATGGLSPHRADRRPCDECLGNHPARQFRTTQLSHRCRNQCFCHIPRVFGD